MRDGRIVRARLGVAGMTVPIQRKVVRFHRLIVESGVMVSSVEAGSAADKAGIRPNDIVITFGEHPVTSIDVLHKLLSDEHADVKTPVTILRGAENAGWQTRGGAVSAAAVFAERYSVVERFSGDNSEGAAKHVRVPAFLVVQRRDVCGVECGQGSAVHR